MVGRGFLGWTDEGASLKNFPLDNKSIFHWCTLLPWDHATVNLILYDDTSADSDDTSADSDDTSAESYDTSADSDDTSSESDGTSADSDDTSADSDRTSADSDRTSADSDDTSAASDDTSAASWWCVMFESMTHAPARFAPWPMRKYQCLLCICNIALAFE